MAQQMTTFAYDMYQMAGGPSQYRKPQRAWQSGDRNKFFLGNQRQAGETKGRLSGRRFQRRRYDKSYQATGNVRNISFLRDADILEETFQAYKNPYMQLEGLGIKGQAEYEVHGQRMEQSLFGKWERESNPFSHGKEWRDFTFAGDANLYEAFIDYESKSRDAFSHSFFSQAW